MARTKNPEYTKDSDSPPSNTNPKKRPTPVSEDVSESESKRARNEENVYASGRLSAPSSKFAFRETLDRTAVWINLESFKEEGYVLEKWLGPYRNLLAIKNSYNVEVLRSFYSKLSIKRKYDKEGNIRKILLSSSVRGKEIKFGFKKINKLLGIKGVDYNVWMNSEKLSEDDLAEAYGTSSSKPADLPGYHRLVHYAYTRLMTHKNGNFGAFTLLDNPWLARLLQRQPINLGQLMIMEITRFIEEDSSKSPLPFPQFISFLLESFKIKSLQGSGDKVCKEVNTSIIRKMNIPFEESSASSEENAPSESSEENAPEEQDVLPHSSPDQAPQISQPEPNPAIAQIISKVTTEFAAGLQRINNNFMSKINFLEEQHQRLNNKLNSILEVLALPPSDHRRNQGKPSSSSSSSHKSSPPPQNPPSPIISHHSTSINSHHSPSPVQSNHSHDNSPPPPLSPLLNTCQILIPYPINNDDKKGENTDINTDIDVHIAEVSVEVSKAEADLSKPVIKPSSFKKAPAVKKKLIRLSWLPRKRKFLKERKSGST